MRVDGTRVQQSKLKSAPPVSQTHSSTCSKKMRHLMGARLPRALYGVGISYFVNGMQTQHVLQDKYIREGVETQVRKENLLI